MPLAQPILSQSAIQLLAYAVCDTFPGSLLVGSSFSNIDFSLDVILHCPLDSQGLILLEEKMRHVIKADLPVQSLEMMRENAVNFLRHHKQDIKADIVSFNRSNIVRIFQMDDFVDFCPASHMSHSGELGVIKLLEADPVEVFVKNLGYMDVIRIRGAIFTDRTELKRFVKQIDEAKKYDHCIIGPEMNLFTIDSETFRWLPKGSALVDTLQNWVHSQQRQLGFQRMDLPLLLPQDSTRSPKKKLVTTTINEREYLPFPTPQSLPLIKDPSINLDQPLRYFSPTNYCNLDATDRLHGLLNPRSGFLEISQIQCSGEKLIDELTSSLQFIGKILKILGFKQQWHLTPNQNPSPGNAKGWQHGYNALEKALALCKCECLLDKQVDREYGPRAEVGLTDATGREWRGPFLSVDLKSLEEGSRVTYSVFGLLERFIALLIEKHQGILPLWLAPEQVRVLPISSKNTAYADGILRQIEAAGFRCEVDYRPLTLAERILCAEKERVPYFVIVGDREERNGVITVRPCQQGTMKSDISLPLFLDQLKQAALHEEIGVESK